MKQANKQKSYQIFVWKYTGIYEVYAERTCKYLQESEHSSGTFWTDTFQKKIHLGAKKKKIK